MKKRKNPYIVKLVAATSLVIFSLLVTFSGAYAWFLGNRAIDNSSDNFAVQNMSKFYKISYHNFVGSPTDTNCSFNKTPYASLTYNKATRSFNKPQDGSGNPIDDFTFVIDYYDPMNKHKPMLVLIELDDEYDTSTTGEVVAIAKTNTEGFIGAKDRDTKLPIYDLSTDLILDTKEITVDEETIEVDYYPLSSVVSFRSFGLSEDDFSTWSGSTNYDVTILNTTEPTDHDFVEVDHDQDKSSFYNTSTIYKSGASATIKYIAIIVDYNDSAIEYIYSTFLGDTTLESKDYELYYTCDWVWEIG